MDKKVVKGYELTELIGEGGFGAVYRAYQPLIGREVAIKIILPQHANRPEFIRRFESEAQLVARLEHPFIVPLYDYWREPDGAFLVMRWLKGGSIADEIRKNGGMDPQRASRIITQIGEALAVAHRQGVIHRDLKLDNMILDENGNAYLTDFGIAKDLGHNLNITQQDAILGSPAYLSPEQIKGEDLTPQTDIYAMGITLYQMLTGELPFNETTAAALMYKHLSEPIPDITLNRDDLPPLVNLVLQRATMKDPEDRYTDIIAMVKDFRRAIRGVTEATDTADEFNPLETVSTPTGTISGIVLPDPENPYKGLRAFQQADSTDFFGREALTEQLLSRLKETGATSKFLAVIGPSGSGKSSVIKAGVIPTLKRDAIEGSKDWFVVEMVPGAEPMEELEAALLRIAVNPPDSLLNQLQEDERGLVRAVKRVLPDDDTELLLFIDQFEETFTLVDEEDQRQHFLSSLLAASEDERSRIRIIITLRADFYDKPLNYVNFGNLLRQRTEVVLPLSEDELEISIKGPATRVGMVVEPGLVKAIVSDVSSQPGALPLLQYALTELFERRNGNMLTLNAYKDIGGAMGALAKRASELYDGLDDDGKEAARQMFLRLVTLGDGTEDTRRRALQSELLSLGQDQDTMSLIIDAFGRYRLLTFDHDPQTRSATVEIAHEALIRQWAQLRTWLADNRDDLRTQRRLMAAAEDWLESGKDPSFLLRGARLEQFEEWMNTTTLSMNEEEANYLKTSINTREERDLEEHARQQREHALEERSRNILKVLAAVMSVATIIAIGLTVLAFNQSQEAQTARDEAQDNENEARGLALAANARNSLIEHDSVLGLSLSLEANRAFSPTPIEVMRVLSQAAYGPGVRHRLQGHVASVLSADFSTDGRMSASASLDGSVIIWDNDTGEQVLTIDLPAEGAATTVVFSPDNTILLVSAMDGSVYKFDAETGDLLDQFEGHTDGVTSVVFNSDGTQALSGSLDHTLRLWDVATGNEIRVFTGHSGIVLDVALSADGQYAASSSGDESIGNISDDEIDRTVRVWDLSTGEELQRFAPPAGYIRTVMFSPDSTSVISGTWTGATGGVMSLWSVDTGDLIQQFYGHTDIISGIVFLPDGERVASVSWDRTLRLWDISTGIEVQRYESFEDKLLNLSVSADGQFLLTNSGDFGGNEISMESENSKDTSVWLIDLLSRDEERRYVGSTDWIWSVDINQDETRLVSGTGPLTTPTSGVANDSLVRIWDYATGEVLHELAGHTETVEAVAFSPNGTRIISGAWDGQLILWETDSGEEIRRYITPEEFNYTNAKFLPDGTQFVTSTTAGTIILWDVETGEEIRRFEGHTRDVDGIDINSDGTILASGSYDLTIRLWNIQTGEEIRQLLGHTDRVNDVAFNSDGTRLLSSAWDSSLRLWDVESGEELHVFNGHNGPTFGIAFSPDNTVFVSGSADSTVRLWDISTGQEIRRLDGHTNWISEVLFLQDGEHVISGAQDNTIRLWQTPQRSSEVVNWAINNRYVRELSCGEREQFRVEPLCESDDS
ncbi:MAG: protein kinase [Aggregatilineales bacterium]